jgi:hypothetical protein
MGLPIEENIDIIDGFIVRGMWFYAVRRLDALRTSLHFLSLMTIAKTITRNGKTSFQPFKTSVSLSVLCGTLC